MAGGMNRPKEREWGSECCMMFIPPGRVEFRQGDMADVRYLCPPLPLTPPSLHPCRTSSTPEWVACHQRLRVVFVPGGVLLLCYCSGLNTLSVGQLSEQSKGICSGDTGSYWSYETFEEWSNAKGRLVFSTLKCVEMEQQIQALDCEVVDGVGYLCITCTSQLAVYQISPVKSLSSCNWMDMAVVHCSPCKILHSKLSPHVPSQVLVMMETGRLCLYQEELEVVVIRESVMEETINMRMCLFGSHPWHVLWVEGGRLYSSDLRMDKLPLPVVRQAVEVGEAVEVVCVASGGHPFHVLVATRTDFMVLDIRQPAESMLSLLHNLSQPPTSITSLSTAGAATSLVLVTSLNGSVVFSYTCISPYSVVLACPPHAVCSLSDMLKYVKHSEMHALCSQVGFRFMQPTVGSGLFTLPSPNTYGAVMLTVLGDVMYQCWQYRSPSTDDTVSTLSHWHHLGLSLWMKQAYAERKVSRQQSRTVKDLSSICRWLISGQSEQALSCTKSRLNCIKCNNAGEHQLQQCQSCSIKHSDSSSSLHQLKSLYEELIPCSQLDTTIISEWGRCGMEELFNDEDMSQEKVGDAS